MMKPIAFWLLMYLLLASCTSTYYSLQPQTLEMNDHTFRFPDRMVEVSIEYDVLKSPGSSTYARMEKKHKVSLVALQIQNNGSQPILLPGDFNFHIRHGDMIKPLSLEDAMSALIDPVTNESSGVVEVETRGSLGLILGAGKAVNQTKRVVSHVRFSEDMLEYYLENKSVSEGNFLTGFLALPVPPGTRVDLLLREPASK